MGKRELTYQFLKLLALVGAATAVPPPVTKSLNRHTIQYTSFREGYIMKIIVIKSPKLLAGMFRLVFGIKRQETE